MEDYDRLLTALRRIIRATDLNAKRLAKETGLTPSQLILLQTVEELAEPSIGRIAKSVNLTQATVTSLVERLEKRDLVARRRGHKDRRIVYVDLTDGGADLLEQAPKILQDRLQDRFHNLKDWEKSFLIAALDRTSELLDAEDLDVSLILDVGSVDRPSGER